LGISKRGDRYLRSLLVHGARAMVSRSRANSKDDPLNRWINKIRTARGMNKATAALATNSRRVRRQNGPHGLGRSDTQHDLQTCRSGLNNEQ